MVHLDDVNMVGERDHGCACMNGLVESVVSLWGVCEQMSEMLAAMWTCRSVLCTVQLIDDMAVKEGCSHACWGCNAAAPSSLMPVTITVTVTVTPSPHLIEQISICLADPAQAVVVVVLVFVRTQDEGQQLLLDCTMSTVATQDVSEATMGVDTHGVCVCACVLHAEMHGTSLPCVV